MHGRHWVLTRARVQGLWLGGFEAGYARYLMTAMDENNVTCMETEYDLGRWNWNWNYHYIANMQHFPIGTKEVLMQSDFR